MKRTSRIERLARHEEQAVIKRVVVLSLISIVLITLIFAFGTSTLGKFSDFLSSIFNSKGDSQLSDKTKPPAPRLDTFGEATNSAKFKISGFADGKTVEVFLNGDKIGEKETVDGTFKYDEIILQSGQNVISAKTIGESGQESDFSQESKISLITKEPELDVISPSDGDSFSGNNRIKVTGKADPSSQVYANGFLANIGGDGHFEVSVPLSEGENNLEVKAIDDAGNSKVITKKISYHK